ncbi:hypothetical protein KBA73_00405 [Patescibacteria group bacterium]|nr:hypothetical protein [Patescibacteria group bacterium]
MNRIINVFVVFHECSLYSHYLLVVILSLSKDLRFSPSDLRPRMTKEMEDPSIPLRFTQDDNWSV